MDAISAALIEKALDGLSMRQSFLAQNIANGNSADYAAMNVLFEGALKAASEKGVEAIDAVTPRVQQMVNENGTDAAMRLDMQLAESSKTALRYSALVEVMARQMGLTRAAITGGQ